MKKQNKQTKLYWLIPLIVVVLWFAVGAKAGIVRNGTSSQTGQDSLSVPLFVLDTAGNRVEFDTTADWGYIVVRYPNGVKAVSDSFTIRGTNTPKIVKNAAEYGGFLQYCYRKQISDLDGTPINGTYSFEVTVRDSSLKLWTVVKNGEFQLYQTMTYATFNDSLTTAITATNKANFKATGFADSMRDVVGDTFNVVSGGVFLAAAANKSVADSIRDVIGDSTTSWKHITKGFADSTRDVVGDTFNVVSGGVFLAAAANKSVADSIRDVVGDSTTAWKFNDPDSGATARISKRMWGVQLGAAGSSDSLTKAQRLSALPAATPDTVRDIVGDSTTVWKYGRIMPDSVRDIFGDSTTAWKYYTKGLADSTRDIVGDTFNVVSGGVFLSAAGNKSVADSVRDIFGDSLTAFMFEVIDSLRGNTWSATSAGSGVDSAVVSRIMRRMWGIQLGAAGSTDSLTKAQRLAALPAATPDSVRDILGDSLATFSGASAIADTMRDVLGDTINAVSGGVFLAAAANKSVADSVRDVIGDSTTSWKYITKGLADSTRDIFGDSTTTWKYYTKGLADSMRDVVGDTFNVVSGGVFLAAAANKSVADSVRDIVGDSTTVWKYGRIMPDSVRDIFGDSTTSWKYVTKGLADSTRDIIGDSTTAWKFGSIDSTKYSRWSKRLWGIKGGASDTDTLTFAQRTTNSPAGTGLDSATTSRIVKRTVWGVGGGSSGSDSTTLGQRTATATGTVTADVYPLLGPKFVVDAVGTDGNSQFVADTASLGVFSSDQDAIINRAIIIRSLSGDEVSLPTTIKRVAYTGANCSLTVNIDVPKNFAANDTIQFTGLPWHDFATLAEASDSNALALLAADTTGLGGDATVGGAIVAEGSDTTKQKAMLTNMGLPRGLDSLASLSETATADGTLRRGEIVTARAAAETTSVILADDSLLVKGGIIDTVLTATSVNLGSDSVFVKGGVVDTLLSQVAGSGGSCTGSGPIALTIVVYDSVRDVVVADARIGLYTTSAMSGDPSYYDVTGASGTLAFNVNSGTYYISGRAGAKTFEPAISVVATSSPTLDTVFCEGLPTSLFTYLYGQEILPDTLVGAVVTLELVNYSDTMNVNDLTINPYKYSTRVDVNGEWAIPNVLANSKFDANSRYVYRITHPRLSRAKSFEIEVPDTSQVNIAVLPKKKVQ